MKSSLQLGRLTEETINKHVKEIGTKRELSAEKKIQTANKFAVTRRVRSQGDGESFDFDENIQTRLKEIGDENNGQPLEETPAFVSAAFALSPDMEKNDHEMVETKVEGARSNRNEKPALSVEAKAASNHREDNRCDLGSNGTQKYHQLIHYGSKRNRSVTSVSSAESESEESVVDTSEEDDKSTNETSSSTSSSFSEEDDEEDDDSENDDDDSDDADESEEMVEGETSDEEVTHYSSSLNASISSIPTLNEDRELSPESPEAESEQHKENKFDKRMFLEQEMKAGSEEAKNDESGVKIEEEMHSNHSPPSSRQVSGRSATPCRTVFLTEFDDVESGIFDRKESSRLGSSSITSPEASRNSDVTIKNWPGFFPECVTSHVQSVTPIEKPHDTLKRKESKTLKTKKIRNAILVNRVERTHTKKIESKCKACDAERLDEENTSCSSHYDNTCTDKIQTKAIQRKRKPKTQVSFEQSNPQSLKIANGDSEYVESCTLSRGAQSPSSHLADSEHSGQAGNQFSDIESEGSSSSPGSARPVRAGPSTRRFSSSRQRFSQTSVVDNLLVSHEKKRPPSKRPRNGR